jgi:hypothetical protein
MPGGGGVTNAQTNMPGGDAGANTGGGGGGGSHYNSNNRGGNGGSGIVIIKYPYFNNSVVITPTSSTVYTLVGSSSVGCISAPVTTTISVGPFPTLTVNSGSICLGQSFTIQPSGASTYSITGGTFTVNPSITSTYTVTGTSSAGCSSTLAAVAQISVNPLPTITVNSGSICANDIFTIVPSGASTFSITGGSFTVSPPSNTDYTVSGTSTAGCVNTLVAVSNVSVFAIPTIAVAGGTICNLQVFTITPSGASTYSYSNGATGLTATVNPNATSAYSVIGTSSAGCVAQSSAVATVSVFAIPSIITLSPVEHSP